MQIDAAVGKSQIVDDARNLTFGITSRMVASTASQSAAVSSIRVPVACTQVQLDMAGVDGREEVWPRPGRGPRGKASRAVAAIQPRNTGGETRSAAEGRSQQGPIPVAHPLEASFEPLLKAHQRIRLLAFARRRAA